MSHSFHPRVAIVTGGAAGLGAAIAKELAATGTHVIVADIDFEKACATAREIGSAAEAAKLDVSDGEQIRSLIQRTKAEQGSLDLMVNNAGISCCGEMLELSFGQWQRVLQVNLWGVIAGSVAAYSVMAGQGGGHIVNIASMATSMHNPMLAPVCDQQMRGTWFFAGVGHGG